MRSSATMKSTAHPSCLVGVLYDIFLGENLLMANQPHICNWPGKSMPNLVK